MNCHEFRGIADSYLSNELSVEGNHEIILHVDLCPSCRIELSARRELRSILRNAFVNAPQNQVRQNFARELSTQLRENVHANHPASQGPVPLNVIGRAWLAVAACLILAAVIGVVMFRELVLTPEKTVATQSVGGELIESAVGDHKNCAIKFRLAEKPVDLEIAGRQFDSVYINLKNSILSQQENLPVDAQFVEAHSCVYEGRRFAHVVFKYHGRLVSVLVTNASGIGAGSDRKPATPVQSSVIASSQTDGFQVAGFETVRHAIFVVSDLSEAENLALARALAPVLLEHISHNESST